MVFVCNTCKKEFQEDQIKWRCDCGGYLSCKREVSFTKKDIKSDRFNMWRYDAAYPLQYEDLAVTYQEGLTPLVKWPGAVCQLRVKMDSLMPTGSFKDRGTVMVVNYLLKKGAKKIMEDSSGNAGASVAGYCALGKIPCDIFVPAGNSAGKLTQIRAYGANIHPIEGDREAVARAAQQYPEEYAGHNWHPMFLEGTKSIAYELWEQNGFQAPENIVCVAGNGSTILGIYYGFQDLLKNCQVERMPRLFAVQAKNCNPIYREFVGDTSQPESLPTIAEGIALRFPNKGSDVVKAVKNTNGEVLCVDEEEIAFAAEKMAQNGFYVEPTSATAYAGLLELMRHNTLGETSDVIMMISGNGLKASVELAELLKDNHKQGD